MKFIQQQMKRTDCTYIGSSAGAMIAGTDIYLAEDFDENIVGLTDLKALGLFDGSDIRYDKLKKSYSHEIIGPLGQGVGVCEGIAKAVKVLLDALGVWCVIAICGNNPEKGIMI